MTDINISYLANLAKKALDGVKNGDHYMLHDVHNRMRQAYEKFPEDPVIRAVAFVIEKRADKLSAVDGPTISQKEISDIYNECVRLSSTTKFREILGDLLLNKIADNKINQEYIQLNRAGEEDILDIYADSDKTLVGSFSSLLDNSNVFSYNTTVQSLGTKYVKAGLKAVGFDNTKVNFIGGDQDALLYSVGFDTNNGIVNVSIPLAIKAGQLSMPEMFLSNNQLFELNNQNLSKTIDALVQSNDYSKLDTVFNEIDASQQVEMPKELAHLTADFEDKVLEATSKFGKNSIAKGKEIIAYELRNAGFKNPQVTYHRETTNHAIYVAELTTAAGKVEVGIGCEMRKVAENKYMPLVPHMFMFNGNVAEFNIANLQKVAHSQINQTTATFASTNFKYMTLKDLKDEMLKSLAQNNYEKAEEIIAHVQNTFDEQSFANVVADYQNILAVKVKNQVKTASVQKCSLEIPAGKTSVFPVCGHYHVPMDKVVVAADGICKLKTAIKSEMINSTENAGALLSSYKILM